MNSVDLRDLKSAASTQAYATTKRILVRLELSLICTVLAVLKPASTNFLFVAGAVCCSSAKNADPTGNAPNSMVSQVGACVLTLLGVKGARLDSGGNPAYFDPNLGMDLRVTFAPVPVSMPALLILPGLLAIRWLSQRQETK